DNSSTSMAQQATTTSPTQEQGAGTAGDNEQDDVSEEIHQLWLKSGTTRDSMVQTLIDCNGEKVELYKDTQKFRKDKYDEDLEQFWCEKRTIGQQGTNEIEGLKEKVSGSGQSSSLNISGLQGNLDREWGRDGREGCAEEAPKKATDNIPLYMKECVSARDKLTKFTDKLDMTDPTVKLEMPKMLEIRDQLGKLYDGLAGMQADSKVGAMSEAHFGYHPGMTLAISCEVKNKCLGRGVRLERLL
ncbi:unnamed protein product, partial [Symbiodinium necroappetens]